MEPIYQSVQSFQPASDELIPLRVDQIRAQLGHQVETYSELISKLANLAFANPELVLLLRGQSRDHCEAGKTTLFPTMYRNVDNGNSLYANDLKQRYELLRQKEDRLCQLFDSDSTYRNRVGRSQLARWAILQHYEVCPTPLLDVTHSALIAASFAFLGSNASPTRDYFIYVLGVPQISGSVTVASAQALQVVRLGSVCPPETLRPYFQEGYLVGTYPSVDTLDEKLRYDRDEMDCSRRLVAKFRIPTDSSFWDLKFPGLPESAVYPKESSPLISQIRALKST